MASEPDRPPHHHVHAADSGARNHLEFARPLNVMASAARSNVPHSSSRSWCGIDNRRSATMSGLTRIPDSRQTSRHVRKVPEPDLSETAASLRKARTSRDFRCSDRQRISARSLFPRRRSLSTGPSIPPDYLSYQPTRIASAMAYLRASRSMSRQDALAFARSWSVERASSRK